MRFNRVNTIRSTLATKISVTNLQKSNYTFVHMFYILGTIILVVIAIIFMKRSKGETATADKPEEELREVASDCCGAHEICEFDASIFDEEQIVYFDDEELDELRNVREENYTAQNMDDLREVLYTLKTAEISKWLTSLSRRHIHLPAILQQEARQLMAEK
jgi:CBS-domain-containing membrane protein